MVPYDTIRYETALYNTVRYYTVPYDTVRYFTVRYDTVSYDMVRYNMISFTVPSGNLSMGSDFPLLATLDKQDLGLQSSKRHFAKTNILIHDRDSL